MKVIVIGTGILVAWLFVASINRIGDLEQRVADLAGERIGRDLETRSLKTRIGELENQLADRQKITPAQPAVPRH